MKEYEELLKFIITNKNRKDGVVGIEIPLNQSLNVFFELQNLGYITNFVNTRLDDKYVVSCDITYSGLHYFDEND